MHGLVMRTAQLFVTDCYGDDVWTDVVAAAGLEFTEFEAMLAYDAATARDTFAAMASVLNRPQSEVFEDLGIYLVSNPNVEALRRLLRFGGITFEEFLHSLNDLPDRARLAVADLDLPKLELRQHTARHFSLTLTSDQSGFGHVMVGILRTMADDYGALALVEHQGQGSHVETLSITLLETSFSEGRDFDLGAQRA